MMTKNKQSIICILVFIGFLSFSCSNKVIIKRNYIYSTSWDKGRYQGFEIQKIRLIDSAVSVFDRNFNHYFLDKHIIDSGFCYGSSDNNSNRKAKDKMSKIYFDKSSVYYKWYKCRNITESFKTIGLLELNTWYIITGLLYGTEDFYVYIDKEGEAHTYSLGPTNW